MTYRSVAVACALITVVAAAPARAADDSRTIKKIEEMNRTAMEDYDLLEFDAAKKQLNDALALAKRARLDKHSITGKTHLNLGIIYGAGSGDQDTALLEFIAALQIDPDLKLDAAYRSPALNKTFDQAKATVGVGPSAPVASSADKGLKHTPVEEAPGGQSILITARAGAELKPAQVSLSYRGSGSSWTTVTMKSATGIEYQAAIPAGATRGQTVHYYLEAKNAAGKVIAASGNAESPNLISIAHPVARGGEPTDEENPLGKAPVDGDSADRNDRNDRNDRSDDGEEPAPPEPKKRSFWASLGLGTGFGYITGKTEVSGQDVTCCLAPSPFHIAPEFGYAISNHLAVSLYGRIGFPLGANVTGAATLAVAVLGRISYSLGSQSGLVFHGDLGGGFIRHIVKISAMTAMTVGGDTDTSVTGPLFVGGGFGYHYLVGSRVRLQFDLTLLAGIPIVSEINADSHPSKLGFALQSDLTFGVGFGF